MVLTSSPIGEGRQHCLLEGIKNILTMTLVYRIIGPDILWFRNLAHMGTQVVRPPTPFVEQKSIIGLYSHLPMSS